MTVTTMRTPIQMGSSTRSQTAEARLNQRAGGDGGMHARALDPPRLTTNVS